MTKELEEMLNNISEYEGEETQLKATIICLENLINWCGLCFNNDKEKEEYNKLKNALQLLKEVANEYKKGG